MLVSYTYRSDDPQADDNDGVLKSKSASKTMPEMKTFSFYTIIDLGTIVPKEEPRTETTDP